VPTENIGPIAVGDGQITDHDISEPGGDIQVVSAQIRWRGDSDTDTSFNESFNQTDFGEFGDEPALTPSDEGNTVTQNFPGFSGSFDEHWAEIRIDQETPSLIEYDYEIYDGSDNLIESGSDTADHLDGDGFGETTEHYSNSSSPHENGYQKLTFTNIELADDVSGAKVESYTYSQGIESSTTKTQDPTVTRDVDGAFNGSLNDGEWSSWQSLSGLDANRVEEFYHNISGSGSADFEVEYTWQYQSPDPANGTVGFADYDAGVWRECAVADASDSLLDYNHVTVYNPETGNWGALDVVDLDDPNAIDGWEFYDPDVGWLAPREYQTTPI
jgi:hypothetical protein